jgi:hypothetical protein
MPLSHVQRLPNSCARLRSAIANDDGVTRVPPLRSKYPTTLEAWRSDLHQAFLTWLCCTFSLSQTLGALFRSTPFQPCFMPVTSLGFLHLQRFSPTGSGKGFSSQPVLRAVLDRAPERARAARLRGCTHPMDPFSAGRCYPLAAKPILS